MIFSKSGGRAAVFGRVQKILIFLDARLPLTEYSSPEKCVGGKLNVLPLLSSSFLLEKSSYFGINKTISFQKLVGNLDKMTAANLGRQHQRSFNSYFKSSWEYLYLFGFISYYFIPSILLKLVVYIFKLTLLMFLYSLNNTTILWHSSYWWEDDTSIIQIFLCFPRVSSYYKEGEQ